MTTVNVTTSQNTVSITEGNQTTVVSAPSAVVVTASAAGPAGPQGPAGTNFNDSGVVDKSIIYYDSNAGEFVANSTWTTQTLVTGGNF